MYNWNIYQTLSGIWVNLLYFHKTDVLSEIQCIIISYLTSKERKCQLLNNYRVTHTAEELAEELDEYLECKKGYKDLCIRKNETIKNLWETNCVMQPKTLLSSGKP